MVDTLLESARTGDLSESELRELRAGIDSTVLEIRKIRAALTADSPDNPGIRQRNRALLEALPDSPDCA